MLLNYCSDSEELETLLNGNTMTGITYDSAEATQTSNKAAYRNVAVVEEGEGDEEDPTMSTSIEVSRSDTSMLKGRSIFLFLSGLFVALFLFVSSARMVANDKCKNDSNNITTAAWNDNTASLIPTHNTLAGQTNSSSSAHQDVHTGTATINSMNNNNPYANYIPSPWDDAADQVMNNILPGGSNVGYIQYPDAFNNSLIFCSEGNLFLTTMPANEYSLDNTTILHAMKLSNSMGNVLTPKFNPVYPYLVAYTATYSGRREAYLMDLRPHQRSKPSTRLTYLDSEHGALHIIGWEDHGTSVVVGAYSMAASLDDYRLYKVSLLFNPSFSTTIQSIPLSQAIDSVVDTDSSSPTCRYFTRFSQSSNTIRYVGGTAESIWAYCDNQTTAVPLTANYNGTSKNPHIYTALNHTKYLLFLSDRQQNSDHTSYIPTTMNVYAMLLPTYHELYPTDRSMFIFTTIPIPITAISCQFNGLHVREFTVDPITGNLILRIGADLFVMRRADLESILYSTTVHSKPVPLPIVIYSDLIHLHQRIIPVSNPKDVTTLDIFTTVAGTAATLMSARGQLFVNPILSDISLVMPYTGGGMNLPPRRYRVGPGSMTGGSVRILGAWFIPYTDPPQALVLATDPLSPTAEMAFYHINITAGSPVTFTALVDPPQPWIGGHVNGGSVADGGLGSIHKDTVTVSPCGRRVAWADTDGRIVVATLSIDGNSQVDFHVLPQENENHQPMIGIEARLTWSPAGRYLAIEHSARNQFQIISIADLGDPVRGAIHVSRIVQATPDRFNSFSAYWGRSTLDIQVKEIKMQLLGMQEDLPPVATTLYFISDRDVILTTGSPWGSRAPTPSVADLNLIYALPLVSKDDEMKVDPLEEIYGGIYVGDGASELMADHFKAFEDALAGNAQRKRALNNISSRNYHDSSNAGKDQSENTIPTSVVKYATDIPISFGPTTSDNTLSFARRAYAISYIPMSRYILMFQLQDHPSMIVAEIDELLKIPLISVLQFYEFPDNRVRKIPLFSPEIFVQDIGLSTDRKYLFVTFSGRTKVIPNTMSALLNDFVADLETFSKDIVDTESWSLQVWPQLEYRQMYSDAWRMLRDYFYDPNMSGVNWSDIHARYLPLVHRCARREELDDVLKQMSSELSALHVFVYGGEYNDLFYGSLFVQQQDEIASLAATMERSPKCLGFEVKYIAELDPDFNPIDGHSVYSPLSDKTLRMTGQRGLAVGDVIVAVNGESVMDAPDIHMLLRGQAGRTVRLDVLRLTSHSSFSLSTSLSDMNCLNKSPEPVLIVPLSSEDASNVRYSAWEWKTRQEAKTLAAKAGFSVGYIHLRSMIGAEGEDAFIRGFFPDFDKEALIIDVRHNVGGNIDSWLLTALQRKAWMYWQDRARNITTGGMGWDEQFAFRGHVVVLIDEKTSSDGEGFARGISELKLGKLLGTRTWGGGIWLSSDNKLVDCGIASAPEVGTFNSNFGWGLGIEQSGVRPDYVVDNDPREAFDGVDRQLEEAIKLLSTWLKEEPIVFPRSPSDHKDMSLNKDAEGCSA